jgi:CubicO group peptidase (beta-lactamase class C family)
MQRAMRLFAGLAIVSLLEILRIGGAWAVDWSAQKAAQVDALITHYLRPQRLLGDRPPPALSVAIGVNGKLVAAKGYGEARPSVAATERTVYHIGSLTKQLTAAAVLRLIEEGAQAPVTGATMTLDTEMRAVFEGVGSWTAPDEPSITVRSLLTMTSNLPNFTRRPPPSVDPWGAVSAPRLLHELKQLSPHGWPHSFEYSNTSYFLLAQAIEAVRRSSGVETPGYRDYIRASVLVPAGMTQTGFVDAYVPGSDLAMPHYRRRPAFAKPDWLSGCGDMASNVLDMFAWNKALMAGRVIGAESREAMFSDGGRVGPMTYYGMGWFVEHENGVDIYSHSGSVPGFTSYNAIVVRPGTSSWFSVTLLTNSDGIEGLDQLADDLFRVIDAY